MALSRNKLLTNLKKLYGSNIKNAQDSSKQWNASLTDYIKDANVNGQVPQSFPVSLAISFNISISNKTFIDDFDKNMEQWLKSVVWTNSKKATPAAALNFKNFSTKNAKEANFDVYQSKLVDLLHNWFSNITVN